MIRPTGRAAFAAFMLLVFTGATASGSERYSDWGFSIDLPEGFELEQGDGETRFSFGSPDGAVKVDIAVYPRDRFKTAKAGADDTVRRLSGRGSFSSFQYEGRDAAIGELAMGSGGSALRGIGFFVNDAESPTPLDGARAAEGVYDLVVLAYTQAADYEAYKDFIESSIDGFSALYSRRAVPGPMGAKARAALGPARPVEESLRFGEAAIKAGWNPREAAVSQAVVEREYRVLSAYADEPALIQGAIQRFYRMVFRDATPALDKLALEMSAAWETGAWAGKKPAPAIPALPAESSLAPGKGSPGGGSPGGGSPGGGSPGGGSPGGGSPGGPRFGATADPRAYAGALLSWVQGFKYERDPKGSDVVNPISSAFEGRGDCDSRALVMSILLRRENIDSILMISLVHEHALSAVAAPGPGARFPFGNGSYLVAETTAKVDIGRIDATQADPAAWIGVSFPQ
jgi:hypothetical protein